MHEKNLFYLLMAGLLLPFSLQAQSPVTGDSTEKKQVRAHAEYIKGLEEFENENYEEALDHLTTAYMELPDNPGLNYALADAYMAVDDLSNAAFYGKKAAKLNPKNKWYHLKLANIYRRAGRNQATIDELKLALKYHPNATDVMSELASVYSQHGEYLESNKIYDQLLNRTGPDIGIYLQKLQNFNELNMRDSSIVQLKKIRRLDPDNLSTLQMLSNYYLEVNQTNQAKQMLREALEKNRRDPKTLVMLADIYVEETQWDSVGTLLGNVVSDPVIERQAKLDVTQYLFSRYQQDPNNPSLKRSLERILEKFTASEPEYGAAHALAADYHLNENNNGRALEALAKTNELDPGNDMAWRQRIQLLLAEGQYDAVIEAGKKADEHIPQDPFVLYFVGNAHLGKGEEKQALEWFEKASRTPSRKPFKSAIYGSMGDAYSALDQWDKAVEAYEQALSLDPQNHNVLNNYAYYLSERDERLDEAEKMALKAIEQAPENPSYLDTVGWVYYKKGDFEKARRYIKASIDTGSASAEVLEHMGDVMQKLGNPEQARQWWNKALKKDPSRTHLKEKIN
ncbi:tetratricopeptide repeat protein [Halalkalibaculum sp. DA3122]|uniref:tetratricopeptide repeat protein n=1 Tax=unclassified Halalkalibaculum TaxID=2964617 RepID=UPI0037550393